MIIRNEKDRLAAMRMLEDAKLPAEIEIVELLEEITKISQQYYSDETSNLGSHTSGMVDE